jgi:hypothetical protein
VGSCGDANSVNVLGNRVHGRIKPQRVVGFREILVNRLWDPDHPDAFSEKLVSNPEAVKASDHHQGVNPQLLDVFNHQLGLVLLRVKGIDKAGSEACASGPVPGAHQFRIQRHHIPLHIFLFVGLHFNEALPAVNNAHHLEHGSPNRHQISVHSRIDDPLNGRIDSRTVPARGQHPNPCFHPQPPKEIVECFFILTG